MKTPALSTDLTGDPRDAQNISHMDWCTKSQDDFNVQRKRSSGRQMRGHRCKKYLSRTRKERLGKCLKEQCWHFVTDAQLSVSAKHPEDSRGSRWKHPNCEVLSPRVWHRNGGDRRGGKLLRLERLWARKRGSQRVTASSQAGSRTLGCPSLTTLLSK